VKQPGGTDVVNDGGDRGTVRRGHCT